jgi:5-methylcytosine-specific restriction endonuclease McrA
MKRAASMSSKVRQRKVRTLRRTFGDDCWLCGEAIDFALARSEPMAVSLEHVVPRSLGGTNENSNLRLTHRRCNGLRGRHGSMGALVGHRVPGTPRVV